MGRKWICAMTLTLLAMLAMPVIAQAKTMYALESAKVYKGYKLTSNVIATVKSGDAVNVVAVKKPWAKVKVDGKPGYMLRAQLTADAPSAPEPEQVTESSKTMYVTGACKLYQKKNTSSAVVGKLTKGTEVTLTASSGAWGKVKTGKKTGFVKLNKLSAAAPTGGNAVNAPAETTEPTDVLKPGDSGEAVKKLQTRLKELEWFYGDIGGNYQTQTTQAVKDFQEAAGLPITGVADAKTYKAIFAANAPKNVINSTAQPASGKAVEMDWWTSGIQEIFPRGATAVLTDVETKLSWRCVRMGGTNHADIQPKTAQDTAVMKKAYGGAWSWNRRAVWVSINGKKYAGSINGMPHGSGSITINNFDGHHCLHFTNSRTHGSNVVCALHQAAIKRAAAAS